MKRLFQKHSFLLNLGIIVTVSLSLPLFFPVYFREDDVVYLNWARTHHLLDCFRPSQAILFGMFRPVQNLTWWSLYRLSGINPYPYHVAIVLSYLAAMAAFFAFTRTAFSTCVALASLAAYGLLFYFLTYIVFWFSDLTYTLELVFAHGALWLFALAIKFNTRRHLVGAALLFCVTVAAKEPAALIVPLVCAQITAVQWEKINSPIRRRFALATGLMLAVGTSWILLNPALKSRQGIPLSQGSDVLIAYIMQRWSYYAGILTSFPTILVWVAVLFPLFNKLLSRSALNTNRAIVISMGISVVLTLLLKSVPALALTVLILALSLLILLRDPTSIGAIWAAPAILGIMTLDYIVRTYLVECSFGLALLCGVATIPLLDYVLPRVILRSSNHRKTTLVISSMVVLSLCAMMGPLLASKFHALNILSANRQNFASAISFIAKPQEQVATPLLVIDYTDMGQVYERDILPLGDGEKALRQKTMTSRSLEAFLSPLSIPVHNLEWWQTHPEIKGASLLTMNVLEEDFWDKTALQKSLLREWTRGGMRVRLYLISRV